MKDINFVFKEYDPKKSYLLVFEEEIDRKQIEKFRKILIDRKFNNVVLVAGARLLERNDG